MKTAEFKKPAIVAVVVGTILSIINQTECVLHGIFTSKDVIRILLNFLVPFLVASYSRLSLLNELKKKEKKQS